MKAFQPVGGTHADLGQLYDAATGPGSGRGNDYYLDYRRVSREEAKAIREQAGIEAEGYVHSIDESAIRHILGGHGEQAEDRAGSLPIAREDILRIPEITVSPDSIRGGKTRLGMDGIQYVKKVNGIIFYVEEVRAGRKKLTAKTMWKVKAGGSTRPGFAQTSETLLPPKQGQRATSQVAPPASHSPDGPGSGCALSGPTPSGPTLNRPEGGAGPISIIGATEPKVNPGTRISSRKRAGGGPPAQQSPPTLRPNRTRPQAGRLDASAGPASAAGPNHIIGATKPGVNPPESAR